MNYKFIRYVYLLTATNSQQILHTIYGIMRMLRTQSFV